MFRKAAILMGLILISPMWLVMGQQSDAAFWQTQGNTVRDAKGNITYTQIKDPKTFTMKIFDRGQWVTYHYEPNSTKVAKVEGPDTSEDYLYDGDNWNGVTIHARGRSHTIHATDTSVVADDMPHITIERDVKGRDIAVRSGSNVVATISYDANGQVRRLTVGAMSLDFDIQSSGVREVLTANGAVLVTTVAKAHGKRQFPVSLDPVADQLGLRSDWRNTVQFSRSATGSLVSVSDTLHHPIVEIVQFGEMSAAFDTKSSPLFYELRLKYTANPVIGSGGGDAFADPTTALNGILPDGLIIPLTGDASAYVSRPGDGAISSFWAATVGSAPSYLVNDTTVNVCTSFKNLGASSGAVILIHEELHSLGLTEKPGYPNAAMDAGQITQLVMSYCGG